MKKGSLILPHFFFFFKIWSQWPYTSGLTEHGPETRNLTLSLSYFSFGKVNASFYLISRTGPSHCPWSLQDLWGWDSICESLQNIKIMLLFSYSVVNDSLRLHWLQHIRLPCPLPSLPELAQTHVHWVGDAIQPPHLLSSPSPPALNLSQHQGLFQWVGSLHQVAKGLEFQLQLKIMLPYWALLFRIRIPASSPVLPVQDTLGWSQSGCFMGPPAWVEWNALSINQGIRVGEVN